MSLKLAVNRKLENPFNAKSILALGYNLCVYLTLTSISLWENKFFINPTITIVKKFVSNVFAKWKNLTSLGCRRKRIKGRVNKANLL